MKDVNKLSFCGIKVRGDGGSEQVSSDSNNDNAEQITE